MPKPMPRTGGGCLGLFAIVWTGFSIFGLLSAWRSGSSIACLFMVPFILVGVWLMVSAIRPSVVALKIARPEVWFSSDTARPGDTVTADYRQTFKQEAQVNRVCLHFVKRETAIYRRGTDTVTVTHEEPLQETELPGRRYQAGETILEQVKLQVPANAMHTFDAAHNKIQWVLKAKVEIAGWPDFEEEYELKVLAEEVV